MIKVTYKTIGEGLKKPEETSITIFNNRFIAKYNVPNKAESTVKQMWKDGRRGVIFSRGCLIQNFTGKTEEEILEIVKKDIENGILVAKEKTGRELKIIDLEITK